MRFELRSSASESAIFAPTSGIAAMRCDCYSRRRTALGKHPEIIARLVEYPQAMERLSIVPMTVLPVDQQLLGQATHIAVQHGLFTNDAMIVALMRRHQLVNLITNDDDFGSVPELTVWKPR
jgi:predicted nucleic acid-binding protein